MRLAQFQAIAQGVRLASANPQCQSHRTSISLILLSAAFEGVRQVHRRSRR